MLVDGEFKPGRLTTSFPDHEVGLGGLPLQVVRSYDSFDSVSGDFGVRLEGRHRGLPHRS